jgi:hypothetical protein
MYDYLHEVCYVRQCSENDLNQTVIIDDIVQFVSMLISVTIHRFKTSTQMIVLSVMYCSMIKLIKCSIALTLRFIENYH